MSVTSGTKIRLLAVVLLLAAATALLARTVPHQVKNAEGCTLEDPDLRPGPDGGCAYGWGGCYSCLYSNQYGWYTCWVSADGRVITGCFPWDPYNLDPW